MKIILIRPSDKDLTLAENFPGFVCMHVGENHTTLWYKTGLVELNALKLLCALFLNCRYAVHSIN